MGVRRCQSALCEAHIVSPHLAAPCPACRLAVHLPACLQPAEIYVDDESKLTLHGLVQHYVMLHEEEKNRKLTDLLDALDFNQVGAAGMGCVTAGCCSQHVVCSTKTASSSCQLCSVKQEWPAAELLSHATAALCMLAMHGLGVG